MTRTVGTARIVVTGMLLVGGALGMFGDMKTAAVHPALPRVPRMEREQTARLRTHGNTPARTPDLSLVARARSGQSEPCIPVAPITFSARGPMIC